MKTEKYAVERQLDDQGRLQYETWELHDKLHRTDGPAYTRYRPDGTIWFEQWLQHGLFHRTDGPALITYWPDGTVGYEQWRIHDKLHRTDGPAYTRYRPDGTVSFEERWFQGQQLTPEQHTAKTDKENQ